MNPVLAYAILCITLCFFIIVLFMAALRITLCQKTCLFCTKKENMFIYWISQTITAR